MVFRPVLTGLKTLATRPLAIGVAIAAALAQFVAAYTLLDAIAPALTLMDAGQNPFIAAPLATETLALLALLFIGTFLSTAALMLIARTATRPGGTLKWDEWATDAGIAAVFTLLLFALFGAALAAASALPAILSIAAVAILGLVALYAYVRLSFFPVIMGAAQKRFKDALIASWSATRGFWHPFAFWILAGIVAMVLSSLAYLTLLIENEAASLALFVVLNGANLAFLGLAATAYYTGRSEKAPARAATKSDRTAKTASKGPGPKRTRRARRYAHQNRK